MIRKILTKRITIILDNDNHQKLKKIQSQEIIKSIGSVSFSKIFNESLRKSLH